jgi:hypothetical protein
MLDVADAYLRPQEIAFGLARARREFIFWAERGEEEDNESPVR